MGFFADLDDDHLVKPDPFVPPPHRSRYDPEYFDVLESMGALCAFVQYAVLDLDENGKSIKTDDVDRTTWGSPIVPPEIAILGEAGRVFPIATMRAMLDAGLDVTDEIPCIVSSPGLPWATFGDYDTAFAYHPARDAIRASGALVVKTSKGFHLIEELHGSPAARGPVWVAAAGRHLQQGADSTWLALSLRRGYSALRIATSRAKPDNLPRLMHGVKP